MSPVVERFWTALAGHRGPALDDGTQRLDYAQLRAAVARRVAQLRSLGAERVALAGDNGLDWALWDLALLAAGKVCVPLPGFFSPAQQQHVLDDAGVDCLVGEPGPLAAACGFAASAPGLWRRQPAHPAALPAGTCKITYTSGTTGRPKGVCLDAEAQLTVADSLWQAIGGLGVERHLAVLPLATLLENVGGLYAPLLGGACSHLPSLAEVGLRGASGLDLPALLACLARHRPHSLILLPQLLQAVVGAAERGAALPDSLRFVAVGGAHVSPGLLARAEALGLPVYEGYGLSECASVVCLNTPRARRLGTVGQPLPHVEVRLAEDGEVLLRGTRLLGYLGEPPPCGPWLPSGDLGAWEDGFLTLRGRKKHQFVTAYGRNVNPEWVEAELVAQPAIAQAWLYGEALPANVAVLVPRDPTCADAALEQAVQAANRGLPDYARAHHWLRAGQPFCTANGLATANGRLRRAALTERYLSAIEALAADH